MLDASEENLDQQRWLMNNGLFTETAKDSIFMYGSLIHKDIKAVQAHIKTDEKIVAYDIYTTKDVLKSYDLFISYRGTTSLIKLWKLKRLLKRNGNMDFTAVLDRFVKDFCGPTWKATMRLMDYEEYVDESDSDKKQDRSFNV